MALDPRAESWLDQAAAARLPSLWQLDPPAARRQAQAGLAASGEPEPVASITDGSVGGVPVRFYRPRPGEPGPVLVYCHGGGWVTGDLDTFHTPLTMLANRSGWEIASVDYRLAPEDPYPAPFQDALRVVEELLAHGRQVAVGGDSAGACLAAMCAFMAGTRLSGQMLLYPVADRAFDTASYREFSQGFGLTRQDMERYWRDFAGVEADPHPAALLGRPDPLPEVASLVFTAECDPLRDEGEELARRLRAQGAPVTFRRWEGMIHGFIRIRALGRQEESMEAAAAWLRTIA